LKQVIPEFHKIAGKDQDMVEKFKDHYTNLIENQIILYDVGREQSEAGQTKWNREEFLAQYDELASSKYNKHYIDMLFGAYCDGFEKLNGDYLFSGKGGIRLPNIQGYKNAE